MATHTTGRPLDTCRLTDTGRQIDRDLKQRFGRAESEADAVRRSQEREDQHEYRGRPSHPIAAVGATLLVIGALVVALTVTALFFVSVVIAVPVLLTVVALGGIWAFWSYGERRRARRESSTIPGDAVPGE